MSDDATTPNETPDATEAEAPVAESMAQKAMADAVAAKREAAKLRKQIEAYEQAEAERKQAEMSEVERAQAKAAELEAQIEAMRVEQVTQQRTALLADAAREARIDTDVATALIGIGEIETAEDAKRAISALAESKPHLVLPDTSAPARVGTQAEPPAPAEPEQQMANLLLGLLGRR